jgi:hypothetical protein
MSATRRAGAPLHRPFFLPLFIQVPRRGVLRTSPVRSSRKFRHSSGPTPMGTPTIGPGEWASCIHFSCPERTAVCASDGGVPHRTRAADVAIAGASIEGARSLASPKTAIAARATTHQSAAINHQNRPYEALPNTTAGAKKLANELKAPCMRITSNTLPLVPL